MEGGNAPKFGWSIFGAWLYLILSWAGFMLDFPIWMIVRTLPISNDGKLITMFMACVLVSPILPLLSIREARRSVQAAELKRKGSLTFIACTSLTFSIVNLLLVTLGTIDYAITETRWGAISTFHG